ncbi:PotD/PotF family extracellular solute-binding protein [Palleronia sp. LCG004]|uniref:ABC transporter substrate-binding protein n=1 Tax=Palleronia sp. LCG004 TaxID=3079304 RepID=UPI002942283F|nr:extracellular solute-binding protein [Palleronia sp. LCG004]WOI56577.1 extracellular solute-binding protein [Palleronia sp. LCG004]
MKAFPASGRRMVALASVALPAMIVSATAQAQDGKDLVVFDWGGYEDPGFYADYIEKYGDGPQFSFFTSDIDAVQKVRAGYEVDVIHPCTATMPQWIEDGLIKPLDTSRLDHWDDLSQGMLDAPFVQSDGKVWMVPFDFGADGIIYRTDVVENPTGIDMLLDPAYKGRTALPANASGLWIAAALHVGVELDHKSISEEQYEEMLAFLREAHQNALFYWEDPTQLSQALKSGEVVVAEGWNDLGARLKAEGEPIDFIADAPEGIAPWMCGYALSATSDPEREQQAYDFLNAISSPDAAEYLETSWGYGHSNTVGDARVDPSVTESYYLDDVRQAIEEKGVFGPLPDEIRARFVQDIARIRAGF